MKRSILSLLTPLSLSALLQADPIFVEAEAFQDRGGWVVDSQFVLNMGSPYLLAHGLGTPVEDASTTVTFPKTGTYRLFVRTKDWVAPWGAPGTPGKFQVLIDGQPATETFGTVGDKWHWQDGGTVEITKENTTITLKDLTGFAGRCDAIVFSSDESFTPPNEADELWSFRQKALGLPEELPVSDPYDLVVVGGGYSGLGAAISAARQGLKVALIQDRPVLGGNGSSEVHVWAQGNVRRGKFPRVGEIVDEFTDRSRDSPGLDEEFGDEKKEALVRAEDNIDLFLNQFAYQVNTEGDRIISVEVVETTSGIRRIFAGNLFCDATGHGTVGKFAGADYEMAETGHLGMSNMWTYEVTDQATSWPETPWALPLEIGDFPKPQLSRGPYEKFYKAEWFWESGFDKHPIDDLEAIRDWNFRANFGAFTALKHGKDKEEHANDKLRWMAFIGGNRESRRLMGDVILTGADIVAKKDYPDGCVPTTWDIDLHYPREEYAKGVAEDNPFISRAVFGQGVDRVHGYPVPYRALYSRNIENLFMAGRCISVDREALGTTRVMRTCGMMGEVVGKAAWIATVNKTNPRGVYENYLPQLLDLLKYPGAARRHSLEGPLVSADNETLTPDPDGFLPIDEMEGLVIDDSRATMEGSWTQGTGLTPNIAYGYQYSTTGKATFPIRVKDTGQYEVRYYWQPHENRDKEATIVVKHAKGEESLKVNLSAFAENGDSEKGYGVLGTFEFSDVLPGSVQISGSGKGHLHADAVQLVPVK